MAPRPQKCPELAKNRQTSPQIFTFHADRDADICYIGNQPLYFNEMILSKAIGAKEVIATVVYITKWFPNHKSGPNWP